MLVPVDLDPLSDRIIGRVALLPLADDARVTILHVVPGSLPARERRSAERDAREALAVEARHLRESLPMGVTVEPLVRPGTIADEIHAHATAGAPELIVMGRGGGRRLRDAFLGSNAERVVRRAQRPVLVVRLRPRTAYKRPAIALDLDQAARESIRIMLLMLTEPQPRVAVIHAYTVPHLGRYYPSLSPDELDVAREDQRRQATKNLTTLLDAALAESNVRPEDGPRWKTYLRYGAPRLAVTNAAESIKADLLVLGTQARRGSAFAFLGTVAGDVLRAARCDVLIVPPRPGPGSPNVE
ncbi:MAG: universal stress protein [Gemmatimonadales bacterium]